MHWQIAMIAVETGIAPSVLMQQEPRMLWTMVRYMVSRAQAQQRKR